MEWMHTWNLIVMAYLCRKKGLQATTLSAWKKMTLLSWYGKESLLLTNNIITPLFVCAFCFCQQLAKTQYSFSPRGAFHQTEFWLLFYFVGKMHTLKGRRSCREFLIPCTLLPHLGSGRFGHYKENLHQPKICPWVHHKDHGWALFSLSVWWQT